VSSGQLAGAAVIVAVAACLQGSVGFGFGSFAAPLLALLDRGLVPGPLLAVALPLTVMIALRDHDTLDLSGVKWAIAGRLPGTVVGVVAVAALPPDGLTIMFCLLVLIAVALSLTGRRVAPTPRTLLGAGLASGVMGTATSIGAPPLALVYQDVPGPRLRATLAGFFVVGASLSVIGLALAGELGADEWRAAAALLVPMIAGFLASRPAARLLDAGWTRPAVLAVSSASALLLLVRELA
jgi:uncharacterized membrane protein YfcA